jgi:hypothetical protein
MSLETLTMAQFRRDCIDDVELIRIIDSASAVSVDT